MTATAKGSKMAHLKPALDGLKVLLERQDAILREILSLFAHEKNALANFLLEAINDCNKKKDTLALKMKMLDEARQIAIEKFASAAGVKSEGLSVAQIGAIAGAPYSRQLARLASSLRDKIEGARLMKQENERLIKFSAHSIRASIYLLTQMTSPSAVYDSGGKVNPPAGDYGLFFSRRS